MDVAIAIAIVLALPHSDSHNYSNHNSNSNSAISNSNSEEKEEDEDDTAADGADDDEDMPPPLLLLLLLWLLMLTVILTMMFSCLVISAGIGPFFVCFSSSRHPTCDPIPSSWLALPPSRRCVVSPGGPGAYRRGCPGTPARTPSPGVLHHPFSLLVGARAKRAPGNGS